MRWLEKGKEDGTRCFGEGEGGWDEMVGEGEEVWYEVVGKGKEERLRWFGGEEGGRDVVVWGSGRRMG